jgi:hypothetical protein
VNPHHWRHLLLICSMIFAMAKHQRGSHDCPPPHQHRHPSLQ